MTAHPELTAELRRLVLQVEDDLRTRLQVVQGVDRAWRSEHRRAQRAGRTGVAWESFRDDKLTQVAVSWVLATVFIRFCEDNGLVSRVWIAGPGARRQQALDAELDYFGRHPEQTGREWLQQALHHLRRLPATAGLVEDRAPLWELSPSGDMANRILAFWRESNSDGRLRRDLADPEWSTRFLGDLYQDLSEHAKKTYALLQTPVFVEEFILDQTLTPALADRPLEGFRLIDPTCGSGHFLLGAFARFLAAWEEQRPEASRAERVRLALASVTGVDKNPFAVAIARFRLTVAALQALGLSTLEDAPELNLRLVAGDSLLPWNERRLDVDTADENLFSLAAEDEDRLFEWLQPGSYDAVVGNPPYISVKDPEEKRAYRKSYDACTGAFVMSVPFMQRFFQLAKGPSGPAGWTGQITSNSFMKREFGSKLIESFLVHKDLRLVADTSGAYIPGHGTPTVIIVGRNQEPVGDTVRVVLGMRGEPVPPRDPGQGLVWQEILASLGGSPTDEEYVSAQNCPRARMLNHPWVLSGGSASEVLGLLRLPSTLGAITVRIGFYGDSHADDAFFQPPDLPGRMGFPVGRFLPATRGDLTRDWTACFEEVALLPSDSVLQEDLDRGLALMWPLRSSLWARTMGNGATYRKKGRHWLSWHQLPADDGAHDYAVGFAFVATHNHFVLDRGGRVFNRSAPVIKLPAKATEEDHLELLGVLNSSTACFWLKQNSHNKGNGGIGGGIGDEDWEPRYEFTGTTLQDFPLPEGRSLDRARRLDDLAQARTASIQALATGVPSAEALTEAELDHERFLAESIAVQEDLDWEVYGRYGLLQDPPLPIDAPPPIGLGERAFEIALARKVAAGAEETEWFNRHGSTPITEIPERWPADYQQVVRCRIELIESDRFINLLERPEFKRRWATEPWAKTRERLLREWILDRLEDRRFWFDRAARPAARSIAQLADEVTQDAELMQVIRLWEPRREMPLSQTLARLMLDQAVPYLAAYRLKETGMRKFAVWQQTWALQRREDAGEQVEIPVPPKYTSADFRKPAWWQARGKLDVPKERFILYPDANRASDPSALLGWAGWDHLQQALALTTIWNARADEGTPTDTLVPLVAGLAELEPWVRQWHSGYDVDQGMDLADYITGVLRDSAHEVGRTSDQLAAWRPATLTRGRKR
ncbi:BREX-2 system adenine-specific DNA-methyltransferase PglX [Naumannella sp. ID2617S]|nr:BREX-2 system adenine-specific DNA-methyltransferase PglX [Naumannella sp. ID2617S]